MPEVNDWGFADAADARRYLSELVRLWAAWLAALAALMFVQGLWVLAAGAVAIGLLLWLARPLQVRAATIVPTDSLVGGRLNVVGKGTKRDRALKAFAYGKEPLEEAVTLAGAGRWLVYARPLIVAATVVAFLLVLFGTFSEPVS